MCETTLYWKYSFGIAEKRVPSEVFFNLGALKVRTSILRCTLSKLPAWESIQNIVTSRAHVMVKNLVTDNSLR